MKNHTIILSLIICFLATCNILNGAQSNYCKDDIKQYLSKSYSYFDGDSESNEKDLKKAYECFLKAALTGNPEAERLVGLCMSYGYGVEKNHREAFRWYEKSANQGDAYALFNLAFCYESGQGTDVNYQKAKHYYHLALEKGLAAAYLNLGLLYLSDEANNALNDSSKYGKESLKAGAETAMSMPGMGSLMNVPSIRDADAIGLASDVIIDSLIDDETDQEKLKQLVDVLNYLKCFEKARKRRSIDKEICDQKEEEVKKRQEDIKRIEDYFRKIKYSDIGKKNPLPSNCNK